MTATPMYRFRCDRCGASEDDTSMRAEGNAPKAPADWATIKIGSDPSAPHHHLCPKCNNKFGKFMEGA
jgi:hypothetical protein